MKGAHDMLRTYQHGLQFELVRPAVKLDNRASAARSLQFWAATQNAREKVTAAVDVPSNDAVERLAEGYVEVGRRMRA